MDNKLMALAIIPGLLILIYVYGKDKVEALAKSMQGARKILYQDKYYRRDIGQDL